MSISILNWFFCRKDMISLLRPRHFFILFVSWKQIKCQNINSQFILFWVDLETQAAKFQEQFRFNMDRSHHFIWMQYLCAFSRSPNCPDCDYLLMESSKIIDSVQKSRDGWQVISMTDSTTLAHFKPVIEHCSHSRRYVT